jgi:predicted regulator of Ras-like GTPase activity (Roadblock/LC7/MglB family)
MYRLVFRKSWIGFLALIGGAAIISALPMNPFNESLKAPDLPFLMMVGGQIALAYLFAAIHYRTCPALQQFGAFFNTLAVLALFGIIGNLTGSQMVLIQDENTLHFNAIELGMMNLLAIMVVANFFRAEKLSSFADSKVAEAQLERLKAVKVDPDTQMKWEKAASTAEKRADGRSLRSTMTNLKAISLAEPGQELKPQVQAKAEAKESSEAQAPAPPPAPSLVREPAEAGSLASLLDRIGDEPEEVSSEFQDFTPESAPPEPAFSEPDVGTHAESAPAESTDIESAHSQPAPEPEPVKAPEPSHAPMMGNFKSTSQSRSDVPTKPVETTTSQASPQSVASAAVTPAPEAPQAAPAQSASSTANRLNAMKRRNTSTFTKLQSLSASGSALKPAVNLDGGQMEPDSLKSLLDRLDDDHEQEPAQPLTPPVELALDTVFKEEGAVDAASEVVEAAATVSTVATVETAEVADSVEHAERRSSISERLATTEPAPEPTIEQPEVALANLLDREEEPVTDVAAPDPIQSEEQQESEGGLFEGTVDGDIDSLFSELAPPEAQLEVKDALKIPHEEIQQQPAVVQEEAEEEKEEESGSLFEGGVDQDIDSIFSELAPPEAQREVSDLGLSTGSVSAQIINSEMAETAGAAESEGLFAGAVDSDIDNIFSELAPPEAQLEVKDTLRPAAAAVSSEEPEEESGGLFAAGVDSDIDNIFSELAPAEAQKEVKDVLVPAVKPFSKESPPAPVVPVAEAPPEATAETATETTTDDEGGLFTEGLGADLDNIFSGLTEGQQLDVNPSTLAKLRGSNDLFEPSSPKSTGDMPAMTADQAAAIKDQALVEARKAEAQPPKAEPIAAPAPTAPAAAAQTPAPSPAPTAPVAAAQTPAPSPAPTAPAAPKYKEVKEFGRLSSKAVSPSSKSGAPESVGTMKTIGKLLLDVQAVENIIKSGETKKIGSGMSTAKIISAARGEGIKNILTTIDTYPGVAGSLIVGHDGLVIASTVQGWDKDMLGALSTALLSTSNLATKKLEIGKLRQMVMLTSWQDGNGGSEKIKTTILTDVDVGILAVFLEDLDLTKLDGLLDTIHTTIHGG